MKRTFFLKTATMQVLLLAAITLVPVFKSTAQVVLSDSTSKTKITRNTTTVKTKKITTNSNTAYWRKNKGRKTKIVQPIDTTDNSIK